MRFWTSTLQFSLFLILCSGYFQYIKGLNPCVMCIYERIGVCVLIAISLLACLNKNKLIEFLLIGAGLFTSVKTALIAYEHVNLQLNPVPWKTCPLFPELWFKIPIDKIVFFKPTGVCSQIDWMFLNLTMAQWILLIFVVLSIAFGLKLIQFITSSRK